MRQNFEGCVQLHLEQHQVQPDSLSHKQKAAVYGLGRGRRYLPQQNGKSRTAIAVSCAHLDFGDDFGKLLSAELVSQS